MRAAYASEMSARRKSTRTSGPTNTWEGLASPAMETQQLHRASRLTSLVCVAALTIGGCGSSYKGLSKADFVNQALAICTKSTASIKTIRSSIGNNPTIGQVKDTFA